MDVPAAGAAPVDTTEQKTANNLDTVAKTLVGATVTVTALLTALGISTDAVDVAFNNRGGLIFLALGAAVLAVTLSLIALLLPPTTAFNIGAAVLLGFGVLAYAGGLLAVVFSASDAANSEGRPTLTNIKLERPGQQAILSFKLKADGVERDELMIVYVKAVTLAEQRQGQNLTYEVAAPARPFFNAFLRPNAAGVVEQEIVVPFDPAGATDLTIEAWSAADQAPNCTARGNIGSGCATVRIPAAPPAAAK